MDPIEMFWIAVAFILGLLTGNFAADHATLCDCAVKGQSRMEGGGWIKCEVVKGQQ